MDKGPFLQRKLVEQLMFGAGRIRRFTQDSPVLPDVWLEYALGPGDRSAGSFPERRAPKAERRPRELGRPRFPDSNPGFRTKVLS